MTEEEDDGGAAHEPPMDRLHDSLFEELAAASQRLPCQECLGTGLTRWLGSDNSEEIGPCTSCAALVDRFWRVARAARAVICTTPRGADRDELEFALEDIGA